MIRNSSDYISWFYSIPTLEDELTDEEIMAIAAAELGIVKSQPELGDGKEQEAPKKDTPQTPEGKSKDAPKEGTPVEGVIE